MLLIGACFGMFAATVLAVAPPAGAQPPDDSNIKFDAPGFLPKKPKPGLPDVKAQPLAWPRLDPGSVLCRTEADLDKLGARRRGEAVDGPIDCQVVRAATAISIVQRKGPGRAEVKTSDASTDGVTGWTDAWLPEKGAIGSTSVTR
jgi:hypothetical protein